jgi:hypothetical protein
MNSFAMPHGQGNSIVYRARFSGFTATAAKEACRQLARAGISCFTLAPQG